jgi:hypothetical protein
VDDSGNSSGRAWAAARGRHYGRDRAVLPGGRATRRAPVTVLPGRTTLAGLLDSLAGQSGVPLDASPGPARDALWNAGRTDTLRAVTEQLARNARSQWLGSGVGGYRLIRSSELIRERRKDLGLLVE